MNNIDSFRAPVARVSFVDPAREYGNRRVFGSHSNTAHVWASNRVTNGRSGDDRMSFDAGVLYSYGTHFALGIVLETTGGRVTLLNTDSYSVSTGKHKSHASYAANGETLHAPALTSITAGLQALQSGRKDSWQTVYIRTYIEERILTAPVDVIRFLAGCIGLKAGNLCVIYRKRVAADAKKEKARLAADKGNRINRAKHAAAMSDTDFQAWILGLLDKPLWLHKDRRHENGGEVLKRAASELRKLHKDAKAWLGVRAIAKVKARLDSVTKDSRRLLAKAARTEEIGKFQRYRQTFETVMATGPIAAMEKHNAETINRTALHLADTCNRRGFKATANRLAAIAANASRRHDECTRIERAEAFRKEAEGRAAWLAGSTDSALRYKRYSDELGRALVRAVGVQRDESGRITGGTLQTSHGAEVPLNDAIRVFRMAKLCRERGQGWKRNGATLPVSYYQVDSIDATGSFVAGCHKFSWDEIARLAGELGLAGIAPEDTTTHG